MAYKFLEIDNYLFMPENDGPGKTEADFLTDLNAMLAEIYAGSTGVYARVFPTQVIDLVAEMIYTLTTTLTDVIRGLRGGTTYHVRAYATNESGTSYGADVSFTTPIHSIGISDGKIAVSHGKTGIVK